ncbi:phosphotransferase family protein [Novosphingobium sp. MMS21-SN21R]|uniref:phosphotransferase family protein n=1 Tax=Novosphingobium sp. MMS21-SN21R TaxID=2969298 RepID=UPI002885DF03|nr:phosphotransferase family protein [Novosphingobium sp. MMS21-SN21R]MDT0509854.1 phosphotransferase family protein [Novosphingobium sp. MMS21-SN21R]
MSSLETQIAAYLAHAMPDAHNIVVDDLGRIYGGSSQETFRFHATWMQGEAQVDRRLILRRDATAGLVVAERDLEYNVYRALAGQGLPIPGVYFLELDPRWLERPFFIMDMCPGKPGSPFVPTDPYDGHSEAIGEQYWSILGRLAAIDHRAVGLETLRNGLATGGWWALELDRWESLLDENEALAEPAVRGAMRWLRRNPPPEPAKPAIVHGDYRSGNFLFTNDGTISAILDWEMCHIGDPLEDVTWGLDPFWPITRHYPLEPGLALWEQASGQRAHPAALDWWRLFSAVKACVIWTTAASGFASGKNREMTMALSGIRGGHFHRDLILKIMRERGAMG